MPGTLFIVGTPIGNLGDLSPRALETLLAVDFIACEDTRVSRGMLTRFDIHKPLVSYYEHNSRQSGQAIAARLASGESAALISDAGMPVISDPGSMLVADCIAQSIPVTVVPGPTALTSAIALSTIPAGRFCFEGFLSTAAKSRREHLAQLTGERRAIVFYEAPHKLLRTLSDLFEFLGDRSVTVCRELTKLHEETLHLKISQAIEHFTLTPPKGEFVLIIQGAEAPEKPALSIATEIAYGLVAQGSSHRDAAKAAALETGLSRRDIYEEMLKTSIDNEIMT